MVILCVVSVCLSIVIYPSLCKYINVDCCVYEITQSAPLSIAEILLCGGFFVGFVGFCVVFFVSRKGQILEKLFLQSIFFSPCYSDDLLLNMQY